MALSESWDATKPAGTRDARLGDDDIREFKRGVAERWKRGGHHVDPTTTTDNDAGLHFCGGDPDGDANQFVIYQQSGAVPDTANPAVTVDQDDAGTKRVKIGDGVDGSNSWTLTADVLEGERYHTLNVPLPAAGTGRVEGVVFVNRGGGVLRVVEAQVVCFTAPSGSALTVDVNKYTVGVATDPSSAGTTILNAVLSVAVGEFASSVVSTGGFSGAANFHDVAVGDALVFDVDALNSADGIVVVLKVRRIS